MIVQILLAPMKDVREGNVLCIWSCLKWVIRMGSTLWNEVYFALDLHAVAAAHDEHSLGGVLSQSAPSEKPPDSSDHGPHILQTF